MTKHTFFCNSRRFDLNISTNTRNQNAVCILHTQAALSYFNIPKNAKFYAFPMKIDNSLLHSYDFYAILIMYNCIYRTGV